MLAGLFSGAADHLEVRVCHRPPQRAWESTQAVAPLAVSLPTPTRFDYLSEALHILQFL